MAKDEEKEAAAEAKGGGKGKMIIMLAPLVILILAAAWFFLLRPKSDSGAAVELPEPKPGAVVALDPITINLAKAHFLKLGLALQPTASATELDGSKALDLAITVFSGKTLDELSEAEGREAAKEELTARVKLAYLPEGKLTEKEIEADNEKFSNGKAKTNDELTAAQAEKRAKALTVQPDVYEIYFTEFVMQ